MTVFWAVFGADASCPCFCASRLDATGFTVAWLLGSVKVGASALTCSKVLLSVFVGCITSWVVAASVLLVLLLQRLCGKTLLAALLLGREATRSS